MWVTFDFLQTSQAKIPQNRVYYRGYVTNNTNVTNIIVVGVCGILVNVIQTSFKRHSILYCGPFVWAAVTY